jgi:hypothetical protein
LLTPDTAVPRYLQEVLGIPAPVLKPWERESELPYFLRDAFQINELDLLGHSVLLAVDRKTDKPLLGEVRLQLKQVRALSGKPVLYCTAALASYERRRLIEQKVPFIVPGNQLYLPDLGIDLREYFRKRSSAEASALSPSAQAMLISVLLRRPWQSEWQPSAVAAALGYTPMTLSRAVKELAAAGIATPYTLGRTRWLRMERAPLQTWEQARPLLRTPVKRSVWVRDDPAVAGQPRLLAGLSALARHSMLAEPKWPIYALSPAQWRAATEAGIEELPEAGAGACEWQLWSYTPALLSSAGAGAVDPLSLTLSLQDNPDERIQLALDELKEQWPW